MTAAIHLKKGRERPLLNRHPWIFSGAIERIENAKDGDVVDVLAASGEWCGRGCYNSRSQIAVRVLTWEPGETVDKELVARRVRDAITLRRNAGFAFAGDAETNAFRLINSESDFLPGVIADYYAGHIVLQSATLGGDRLKEDVVAALVEELRPVAVYERSDADARAREGLQPCGGELHGVLPKSPIAIREHGLRFQVDPRKGHKTGFYLDQRDNRRRCAELARGLGGDAAVLDAFAYTGAFGIHLAVANPACRVVAVEDSMAAIELAQENFKLNNCAGAVEFVHGNAFEKLRRFRDAARSFDMVILDPPNFAVAHGKIPGALRGYKDINLLGIKLLKPGGILATFCCSGMIDWPTFRWSVFNALQDTARSAQVLALTGHCADHPWLINFPEGEYLKGLFLRIC